MSTPVASQRAYALNAATDAARRSVSVIGTAIAVARRAVDTLVLWHKRVSSRGELARMDERLRLDIGVDAVEVWREASKPFWRK